MSKPILMTRECMIRTYVSDFKKFHCRDGSWDEDRHREKYEQCAAANGDLDIIEKVFHLGWEPTRCSGCGLGFSAVVMVGEDPDYTSSTAILCRACLLEALALLDEVQPCRV